MSTPQTKFYFIHKNTSNAYELSATTDVSISQSSIATKRKVESGKSITDNNYLENKEVTFSGLITSINNKSSLKDVNIFLDEVEDIRASRDNPLVDFYADGRFVPDCIITTLTIDKSVNEGLGAWKTTFRLQQVDFTERARLVSVSAPKPKPENKDDVEGLKNKSGNTLKELSTTSPIYLSGFGTDGIPTIKSPVGG